MSDLKITGPKDLSRCGLAKFTWEGGKAPYKIRVVNGPGGQMLRTLVESSDETSTKWRVDMNEYSGISVSVLDSDNKLAYTDQYFINPAKGLDCIFAPGWNRDKTALVNIIVFGTLFVGLLLTAWFLRRRIVDAVNRLRGKRRGRGVEDAHGLVPGSKYQPLLDGAAPMAGGAAERGFAPSPAPNNPFARDGLAMGHAGDSTTPYDDPALLAPRAKYADPYVGQTARGEEAEAGSPWGAPSPPESPALGNSTHH